MRIDHSQAFHVFRFDPETDQGGHYEPYVVPVREGMTVLEALTYIRDYQDGSLAFRYSCRGAVCGSCAMRINRAIGLACRTQIRELRTGPIRVDPLPHLRVIRDLIVDMDPFFEKYEQMRPWLQAVSPAPERERTMDAADREKIDQFVGCILCAACHGACPVVARDEQYVGPTALAKNWRFLADTRDEADTERLRRVDHRWGVWGCDTVFKCVDVCPKEVAPTAGIVRTRKKIFLEKFGAPFRKSR